MDASVGGGPPCSDGIDNDGDGRTDFPADNGCSDADDPSEQPQCSDGLDNDSDGHIDFPEDPGCAAGLVDDESDPCPNGAGCPQCSDGKDNDGNGKTDYPDDNTGCMSASDNLEFTDDPNICGTGLMIKNLPTNGMDMGMLTGTVSNVSSPCGGGNGLPGVAYLFHISTPRVIVATTDDSQTAIDTILDLRSAACVGNGAEVACHDDLIPSGTGANKKSTLTKAIPAGTYYLIVGGKTSADTGAYALRVEFFSGEGTTCTMTSECGPGLLCRVPVGQTQQICTGPVCSDGRDDDGDGKADYPTDPGCSTPTDDTEDDICNTMPTSPMCPQCSNGIDDNGNGDIDYPNDANCKSASSTSESCVSSEPVGIITGPVTMGTTVGASNDMKASCGSTTTYTAPEVIYRLDIPVTLATLSLNLTPQSGFDAAHSLLGSTCEGAAIACSDAAQMPVRTNVPPGTYYVVVDGYSSDSGTFTLTTSGTIAAGASCEFPLFQSGAITCVAGYACNGTPGSRTCTLAQCNDTVDNDGDGKTDNADPGCTSTGDNDESDDCYPTVGPNCPECADGIDNDGDNQIDYPSDTSCIRPSSDNETCTASELIVPITTQMTTGTTVGAVNDYRPPAGSVNGHLCSTTSTTTATAPDVTYQLDLPATDTLSVSLSPVSYDSTHVLLNSTCGGAPIDCSDNPSGMNLTNVAGGRYYLVIDGYSSGSGTYTINVTGTIRAGESCESPLAQAGALMCSANHVCSGPVGNRRCLGQFQCDDGMDNDGDGKSDYPSDPGCASTSDNDESDDCFPTVGPSCPVCANGVDDDGDMLTDFPADTRCPNASFFSENFCTKERAADMRGPISAPATMGTLTGGGADYTQSCQTSTSGSDLAYGLVLPVPVARLQVDTIGSMADTIISLFNESCSSEIECDDDGGGNFTSMIVRNNVAAGTYAILIDKFGTSTSTSSAFTLNVKGTVAAGTACTHPLFAAGVLACPTGTTCTAGTCQ